MQCSLHRRVAVGVATVGLLAVLAWPQAQMLGTHDQE
jgi:hypothetical protein